MDHIALLFNCERRGDGRGKKLRMDEGQLLV